MTTRRYTVKGETLQHNSLQALIPLAN